MDIVPGVDIIRVSDGAVVSEERFFLYHLLSLLPTIVGVKVHRVHLERRWMKIQQEEEKIFQKHKLTKLYLTKCIVN